MRGGVIEARLEVMVAAEEVWLVPGHPAEGVIPAFERVDAVIVVAAGETVREQVEGVDPIRIALPRDVPDPRAGLHREVFVSADPLPLDLARRCLCRAVHARVE